MKGLACAQCFDIRALPSGDLQPVSCHCGNVTAWWLDGGAGVARYTAKAPAYAWGVGFHNGFLRAVFAGYGAMPSGEAMRRYHDEAVESPGYYFDRSRFGCWCILFKPDKPAGVAWASNEERAAVGLPPYPAGHALASNGWQGDPGPWSPETPEGAGQ